MIGRRNYQMSLRPCTIVILAAALLAAASSAGAASTPEQKCQAAKNKTAGKYEACRQKAEAKLTTSGDATAYTTALGTCDTKFMRAWQKAIDKAAGVGATCLDDPLTVGDFRTFIDEHTDDLATALGGGGLTDCAPDLVTVNAGTAVAADVLVGQTFSSGAGLGLTGTMPDNGAVNITPTTTDQTIAAGFHNGAGTVAGDPDIVAGNIQNGVEIFGVTGTFGDVPDVSLLETGQTTAYGTGSDGDLQKGAARSYTDNGDGTITDNVTALMWEKKSDDGSIHDKDDTYTWTMTYPTMNGTMVTTFLASLNAGGGFAGHTDWRIPNVNELQSILNYQNVGPAVSSAFNTSCAAGCTVTTCSCTLGTLAAGVYASSSTSAFGSGGAWIVYFFDGIVGGGDKNDVLYSVRAVRDGS